MDRSSAVFTRELLAWEWNALLRTDPIISFNVRRFGKCRGYWFFLYYNLEFHSLGPLLSKIQLVIYTDTQNPLIEKMFTFSNFGTVMISVYLNYHSEIPQLTVAAK